MINVELKDGSIKQFPEGISAFEAAKQISEGLARVATCALVNGTVQDLRFRLTSDCTLGILTFDSDEGKLAFRHTASHILSQAVKRIFPTVKLAIGPSIETGFYYDFDSETAFTPDDVAKIEAEMNKIVKQDLPIERFELPRNEAIELMQSMGEIYKVELINDLPENAIISFYKQGDFTDLCVGPHLMSTGAVKATKLTGVAGAYWRGSEKNKMLQRIYGTAFTKKADLEAYLVAVEEAKKRDHRKLGKELDLFSFHKEAPGACFWHPKGFILWQELEGLWRQMHRRYGYTEIQTPQLAKKELWETSGHWEHYKDGMYHFEAEENEYLCLKPMDCPFGILIFKSALRSYRELPIRYNEIGRIFRKEQSGELNGLLRVRQITQDDAHIMLREDQIQDEISTILKMQQEFYALFDLETEYFLSTRPDDFMGEIEQWNKAEDDLRDSLKLNGIVNYGIKDKDGAFYGPKIDVQARDCLGRKWQLATIQLDFQLPRKFDATYVDSNNERKSPVMIHRAIFGSFERFIGIITEHYAGAFPTWLSPVQVKIMPISDKHNDYAATLREKLLQNDVRADIDFRNEKIGYKIREAQLSKVPYMLVIGDKELEASAVAVRSRKNADMGVMGADDFVEHIVKEIADRV